MPLEDLEPWIATWAKRSMYVGIARRGALDGAVAAALQIELGKFCNQPYTGGATDLYKCFDQLQRPIVFVEFGSFDSHSVPTTAQRRTKELKPGKTIHHEHLHTVSQLTSMLKTTLAEPA